MKRVFLALALIMSVAVFANAQPRAIGGRIGYGVDFSYQHTVGANMVNLEVNIPGFNGIGVAATHDWIFPITSWTEAGSWNWYAGVGAAVAYDFSNSFSLGVAGRIGVEYNFDFPLQLSIDWRPVVGPYFANDHVGFHNMGIACAAIGVRYNF